MKNYIYSILVLKILLQAEDIESFSSMQGYTGVINTPNAQVVEESSVEFSFNNQNDANSLANRDYRAEQYFINVGFLPGLELTGRLSEIDKTHRDLSANVKYQIPLYHKYLPKIAIGIQDLGGLANYYDAKYIVFSKEFWRIRASIGYGTDRLDGIFGGIEVKVADWLYLLGDYDTNDKNVGVRVNVPKNLLKIGYLSFMAKTDLDYNKGDFDIGINLKVPLGKDYSKYLLKRKKISKEQEQIPYLSHTKKSIKNKTLQFYKTFTNTKLNNKHTNNYNLILSFRKKLIDFGFENIDIGTFDNDKGIYVAYENNIFSHNELDAMGVILGYMLKSNLADRYDKFALVVKRSNIEVKK